MIDRLMASEGVFGPENTFIYYVSFCGSMVIFKLLLFLNCATKFFSLAMDTLTTVFLFKFNYLEIITFIKTPGNQAHRLLIGLDK